MLKLVIIQKPKTLVHPLNLVTPPQKNMNNYPKQANKQGNGPTEALE